MRNIKSPWKILNSRIVYQNQWMRVRESKVRKADGSKGKYGFVESPPSVFIVALTSKHEVYLIRQYRYTSRAYSWEIPGGGVDNQPTLEAAKRELQEETGLVANRWKKIGIFYALNNVTTEISHVFLATQLTLTRNHHKQEEGIDRVKKIPFDKVLGMIKRGKLTDSQSIVAISQVALSLGRIH